MPQFSPLVLKDRKNPPVDHTFKPRDVNNGVATMVESTGVPLGDRRITFSQTRNSNGRIKVQLKLTVPVVQDATVNGVTRPTVVRTSYVDVQFNFEAGSSHDERNDVVAFIAGLMSSDDSMAMGYIVDLEGLY